MKRYFVVVMVLMLSVVGQAASRNERIQFKVIDTSTGSSMPGVLVTVETSNGAHFDDVTGPSGLVSFTVMGEGGTMDVLITAPNYHSVFMDDAPVLQGRYFIQMSPLQ